MSKVTRTLKPIGLTPWQVVAGVAFCACWFTTPRPMPEAVEMLNTMVAELSMKVEVHAVLIQQTGTRGGGGSGGNGPMPDSEGPLGAGAGISCYHAMFSEVGSVSGDPTLSAAHFSLVTGSVMS